ADRLAFVLAEPDPGIELDLSADRLADLAPPAPASGSHPAPAPRPTPSEPRALSALSRGAAEAQEHARGEGRLTGPRGGRSAQHRIRWAGDWWVRVLSRVAAAAAAAIAGVIAASITAAAVNEINRDAAQTAISRTPLRTGRITANVYSGYASFGLMSTPT